MSEAEHIARARPRDENGWRVPREGTKSRRIYDLARDGKTIAEMAHIIDAPYNTINVLFFRIRRPEHHNLYVRNTNRTSKNGRLQRSR